MNEQVYISIINSFIAAVIRFVLPGEALLQMMFQADKIAGLQRLFESYHSHIGTLYKIKQQQQQMLRRE